jgi:prolyl 4-hydroxylase
MNLLRVSDRPAVLLGPDFATLEECAELAAIGGHWPLIHALEAETKHDETGFSWELPRAADPAVEAIAQRLEAAVGVADAIGYSLRFRRYSPGEGHPPHLDTYTFDGLTLVATALLVLQGPEAGGETRFEHADSGPLDVRAVTGRLIAWANHRPDGQPDDASWHEGLPVLAGQKVTLTLFAYAADARFRFPGG